MSPLTTTCLQLAVFATALKLLLVPTYRSTDFEVHRNWLAITHSLPLSKWYTDATSEWTLDYPPLFAWFECAMSQAARLVDPAMLVVTNLNYASLATIYFQRASVMVTDLVLMWAAYAWARSVAAAGAVSGGSGGGVSGGLLRGSSLFLLLSCNAGLLLVDHVHFQYNGVMMGLLLLSLHASARGSHLLSGLLFAVLLNMKHLFLYAAPAYFVHLLRAYVLQPRGSTPGSSSQPPTVTTDCQPTPAASGLESEPTDGPGAGKAPSRAPGAAGRVRQRRPAFGVAPVAVAVPRSKTRGSAGWLSSRLGRAGGGGSAKRPTARPRHVPWGRAAARLVLLGGAVVGVFGASLGPFLALGQGQQLLRRLFPFGRGLLHAYWAANAWAPYAAADKALAAVLPRLGYDVDREAANMAGGRVGVARFAVLPQVGPAATAVAVLLAVAPCLVALWRHGHSDATSSDDDGTDSDGSAPARGSGPVRLSLALTRAAAYCYLCGFVWGYHVHEKAVLVALLPLAVEAVSCPAAARRFLLLATAGHYGLLPLLFRPQEYGAKILIVLSYFAVSLAALEAVARAGPSAGRGDKDTFGRDRAAAKRAKGSSGGVVGGAAVRLYLAGFVLLELYVSVVHERVAVLRERLPFVPLMLTSLYCSTGVLWVWVELAWGYCREAVGLGREG